MQILHMSTEGNDRKEMFVCKGSPVEGQHFCVGKRILPRQETHERGDAAGNSSACVKLEEQRERRTQEQEGTDRGEGGRD